MGVDLGVVPGSALKFTGLRGGLGRIKTWADEIDDTAEGEVVANDLRKLLRMGLGVVSARAEIGDREANSFYAEARAGAEPQGFCHLVGRLRGKPQSREKLRQPANGNVWTSLAPSPPDFMPPRMLMKRRL